MPRFAEGDGACLDERGNNGALHFERQIGGLAGKVVPLHHLTEQPVRLAVGEYVPHERV